VLAPIHGLDLRERGAQRADGVVGALTALVELGAEQLELLAQRADPTPRMSRPPETRSSVP
jgi:hypothetical protein